MIVNRRLLRFMKWYRPISRYGAAAAAFTMPLVSWLLPWIEQRNGWLQAMILGPFLLFPLLFLTFDFGWGLVTRTKKLLPLKNRYLSKAALQKNTGSTATRSSITAR